MNAYVREYAKIERRTRRRDSFMLSYLPPLLLLAAVVVVGKIYVQSVAIRWSDRVVELREQAREMELENAEHVRSIAALETRERITADATARLDMVAPREDDVVWLPVARRGPEAAPPRAPAGDDRPALRAARQWFEALWQEEALALTSR